MKKFLIGAAMIGTVLTVAAPAQARDGCGGNAHRGPHGRCHSNGPGWDRGGPGPNAWTDGRFYEGRGWWSQGRWYQHREMGKHGRFYRYY
jgi:hypothetical protein